MQDEPNDAKNLPHSNNTVVSHEVLQQRQQQMGALQQAWLDVVYGKGMTLKHRQEFLERYGCAGWTEMALLTLLELGSSRNGIVEMGAGNGQWARVLTDRYNKEETNESSTNNRGKKKGFDFVLAYDDGSRLPLNPEIYHDKTVPAHRHFFPKVRPLHADSVEATLKQWPCRGRVLLLVYPPAGSDMALTAVKAYDEINTANKIVVYVGEGRGGANANDAFFDYLESNGWILDKILPVKQFGSKGYEQLYILRKDEA